MKSPVLTTILFAAVAGATAAPASGSAGADVAATLRAEYRLGATRSSEPRYFESVSRVSTFAPDGHVAERTTYRMRLASTPTADEGVDATYRCGGFTVTHDDASPLTLSSLNGWTYSFTLYPKETEATRPPLGIPHEPFLGLTGADGQPLPPHEAYAVYNTFIDFHSLCDLLARPTPEGKGIQDLDRIGKRVVHYASFTEPRIDLGEAIAKGSRFKNGEITLEFTGIGAVDGVPCAVVGFDSGDASFNMTMNPQPGVALEVVGHSHFLGTLYVELESGWVRRAHLDETVVSQVTMGGQTLDASVSERALSIRQVTPERFVER